MVVRTAETFTRPRRGHTGLGAPAGRYGLQRCLHEKRDAAHSGVPRGRIREHPHSNQGPARHLVKPANHGETSPGASFKVLA